MKTINVFYSKTGLKSGVFIALIIIGCQFLSILVVYNFFRFDLYLTFIAVSFLITGYSLRTRKKSATPEISNKNARAMLSSISNRELEIFRLIATGKTNKEIAMDLNVEVSTVKTHTNNLYPKINCRNRLESREKWNELVEKGLIS